MRPGESFYATAWVQQADAAGAWSVPDLTKTTASITWNGEKYPDLKINPDSGSLAATLLVPMEIQYGEYPLVRVFALYGVLVFSCASCACRLCGARFCESLVCMGWLSSCVQAVHASYVVSTFPAARRDLRQGLHDTGLAHCSLGANALVMGRHVKAA